MVEHGNRRPSPPVETGKKESVMNDQDDVRPNSREEAGDARESDAQDHVLSEEEKLDEGLKDSMDASDPPAATRPGDKGDPVPSSGFKEGQD
ncbi:MAG: hypothetical protein EPO45_08200 [Sphingobium sp.]|nr:hypothetical protein [Sphingobium sp.]TAJ78068.1 MAG: hypothetical protein EPO45_08200 [Sphingobium sp.]